MATTSTTLNPAQIELLATLAREPDTELVEVLAVEAGNLTGLRLICRWMPAGTQPRSYEDLLVDAGGRVLKRG